MAERSLSHEPMSQLIGAVVEIKNSMDRSKVVAVITGAISLGLAIAYLLLVQFLDSRGPMVPAQMDLGLLLRWLG